jgi:uncharacterized protein with PhoU and TrkA domain
MSYGYKSARELLAEAKDTSELGLDLAWTALHYEPEALAMQVYRLQERLGEMIEELDTLLLAATRNRATAAALVGVLRVTRALRSIGVAARRIAEGASGAAGVPRELRERLTRANRVSLRVPVPGGSSLGRRKLSELRLDRTGAHPLAIRSGPKWLLAPSAEQPLRYGNVLYLQSPREGVDEILRLVGSSGVPSASCGEPASVARPDLDRAAQMLVEVKDLVEEALDLAWAALYSREGELALPVRGTGERIGRLRAGLSRAVPAASREAEEPAQLGAMVSLAAVLDSLAGEAWEMVRDLVSGDPVHPVVVAAIGDARRTVLEQQVAPWSEAEGQSLAALRRQTRTGLRLLAARRANRWRLLPRSTFVLQGGDLLVAVGNPRSKGHLARLCS